MSKNKDLFTTYNLNFSAVLVASGIVLHKVDRGIGSKALFCFENSQILQSLNDKYWQKELKVEPQLLFDSLKYLKNRLYNDLSNNNGI